MKDREPYKVSDDTAIRIEEARRAATISNMHRLRAMRLEDEAYLMRVTQKRKEKA